MKTFSRGTLDPWFVTGFVNGEGAFTFSRSGNAINLYFAIKLTAADRALLDDMQEFFAGAGKIYDVVARAAPTPRSGFTKPAAYFRISRIAELERVVVHFDAYPLRGGKARAYAIWRQMFELKRTPRKAPREELAQLAIELSGESSRNRAWISA